MEKLNYQQAYDKIIDAYFKDEIKPFDADFCFCGTLAGSGSWVWRKRHVDFPFIQEAHNYTPFEYRKLEIALLTPFKRIGARQCGLGRGDWTEEDSYKSGNYEEVLFSGMCAALDVLKEIHRSRGENVDEVQTKFVKRELA